MSTTEGQEAAPTSLTVAGGIPFRDAKFGFKKADPLSGVKRPPVNLQIPLVDRGVLQNFLTHPEKSEQNINYLLELLNDQVKEAARQQVADEESPVNTQADLDLAKLDLTYIANLPSVERRGGGIPKEVWEAFGVLYSTVMPGIAGKKQEAVDNAASLFLSKYNKSNAKNNKKVLKVLKDQLDLFYSSINSDQQEEFQDVYEFLSKKADTFLAMDEAAMLENL